MTRTGTSRGARRTTVRCRWRQGTVPTTVPTTAPYCAAPCRTMPRLTRLTLWFWAWIGTHNAEVVASDLAAAMDGLHGDTRTVSAD